MKSVITNSYYQNSSTYKAQNIDYTGTGKSYDEMRDPATYSGWDRDVWNIVPGSLPTLKVNTPQLSIAELEDMTFRPGEQVEIPVAVSPSNSSLSIEGAGLRVEGDRIVGKVPDKEGTYDYRITGRCNGFKDDSVRLTVIVKIPEYNICVSAYGNGRVDGCGIGDNILKEGDDLSITMTPDYGHRIKSVRIDDAEVPGADDGICTIEGVSRDHSVTIEFEQRFCDIVLLIRGYFSKTEMFRIPFGNDMTVEFHPRAGYRIRNVDVNGNSDEEGRANGCLDLKRVENDIEVTVDIEEADFRITVIMDDGSSAESDAHVVKYGKDTRIPIRSVTGYRISSMAVDGVPGEVTDILEFVDVREDHIVNVMIERILLTVTVERTVGGRTFTDDERTVYYGDDLPLDLDPPEGYVLKAVYINDRISYDALNSGRITLYDVRSDHAISLRYYEEESEGSKVLVYMVSALNALAFSILLFVTRMYLSVRP